MKVSIHHATGNANVRAAVIGLDRAGLLGHFHTSVACFPGDILDLISVFGPFKQFQRRCFDTTLKQKTSTSPWKELGRLTSAKLGIKSLAENETSYFSIDEVIKNIDKNIAGSLQKWVSKGVTDIYAYEDGAYYSFLRAKMLGIRCSYDLPIGYWRSARQMLEIEKERWPDWKITLSGLKDSPAKLERKDKELELADHIFVASTFTAKTLEKFPGTLKNISIIPYGYPDVFGRREFSLNSSRRLKILFVGGLSQRKGIANLFAAIETIKGYVDLTVVGSKSTDDCPALENALRKCKWIPSLPHSEILAIMRANDVLIFPSLFEGFGLVITEAMSQGTPVITTDRTAGPDLINNGENGWLINAGSTEQLRIAIDRLIVNRRLIRESGLSAMNTASKRPWKIYGQEIARAMLRNSAC